MKKETKKQLILSIALLCLLTVTLCLWYENFHFHTYATIDDYENVYSAKNEDVMIENYEFSKHMNIATHGGARVLALKDNFFLKNDVVELTVKMGENEFVHKYTIHEENEVFVLPTVETKETLTTKDFQKSSLHLEVKRSQDVVYKQDMKLSSDEIYVYSGGNKDYMIQNIYVGDHWLKTGDFTSRIDDVTSLYSHVTIDYLYLKEQGDPENLDDYERFINITGTSEDVLSGKLAQSQFFDDEGSLLDRTLICVITLDDGKDTFSFKIPLEMKKRWS